MKTPPCKPLYTAVHAPLARRFPPSLPIRWRPSAFSSALKRAFTLVELLVVVTIIVAMLALIGPAVTSLKSAGDVSKTVYDIAGILEQSRAYAMANNTFVYVGFGEADANTSDSGKQTFGDNTVGRVYITAMAARDGSSAYDPTSNGKNLLTIGKVQTFTNIHLVDLGERPSSGSMSRPPYGSVDSVDPKYNLGNSQCASVTPIYYPLGSDASSARYAFVKVVRFDPQGAATVPRTDNTDIIVKKIEVGLQPARGNVATPLTSPVTTGDVAAVQIDGMMGSTRIYRP